MTNFGQRPFMFDIDGYMKVRFCFHSTSPVSSWAPFIPLFRGQWLHRMSCGCHSFICQEICKCRISPVGCQDLPCLASALSLHFHPFHTHPYFYVAVNVADAWYHYALSSVLTRYGYSHPIRAEGRVKVANPSARPPTETTIDD
jgi:hypothetical protein